MTNSRSDALDLLRARFPESEGWEVSIPDDEAPFTGKWWAYAERQGVRLYTHGPRPDAEAAVAALIAAWDAATHAEKVRGLVEAARGGLDPGCCGEDSAAMRTTGESVMCMNCPHGPLRDALAALPEHWKEGVRGK